MADYTGGYTSAVNDAESRKATEQQISASLANQAYQNWKFQQEQENQRLTDEAKVGAMQTLGQMAPQQGPQPPPPGQASQPAGPPPPPPGAPPAGAAPSGPPGPPPGPPQPQGMGGGPPATAAQFGPPPGAPPPPMGASPPPQAQAGAPGAAPPKPPGWQPSPNAPPSLGGGAPPPAAGAAPAAGGGMPPAPSPGGPPAAATGGAQPPQDGQPGQQQPGVLPTQWLSVPKAIEAMTKAGVPIEKQYARLAAMMPMINAQNLDALNNLKIETEARKAAEARYKEIKESRLADAAGKPKEAAPTPFQREAAALYGEGTPEYKAALKKHTDKLDAPARTTVNVGGAGGGALDAETKRFMAEQYWAGDKSVMQNLGRGVQGAKNILELRKEIVAVGKESGKSPRDLATALAEFQGLSAGERTLGTRTANIEMAATEAGSLAKLALDASEKLPRTGLKSLNDVLQAGQKATASPELRAFVAANTSLINAYARAINPQGVGTVADKEHAREMMDTAFSKGDYSAGVNQLLKEIDAARKSPGQVKSSMREGFTGKTTDGDKRDLPPTNGKGWKLMEDKNGNKAYVSPDRKEHEPA